MFRSLIDTLDANIVVLDEQGIIIFANASWNAFGHCNGAQGVEWIGVNYLGAVDNAAASGDSMAAEAAEGIRLVLSGAQESFEQIYPCHSPSEYRYYSLKIRRIAADADRNLFAVWHTQQVNLDSLTGLPNRQLFSHGLRNELSRARRANGSVCLMLIDVDHFKQANDNYGHVFGDECLRVVSAVISRHGRRPSDLAARYGGDEFVLLLGMTQLEEALRIAESIRSEVEQMVIFAAEQRQLTLSIGLAQMWPDFREISEDEVLIAAADAALYQAKRKGRNRVEFLNHRATSCPSRRHAHEV